MNQIERITRMENLLNESKAAAAALDQALDRYAAAREGLAELEACCGGGEWMRDFEDDSAGELPRDLRRGVLSEDAVYDLLTDHDRLLKRMKKLGEGRIRPCLKKGKTPSLGIFFRQDCVDWT